MIFERIEKGEVGRVPSKPVKGSTQPLFHFNDDPYHNDNNTQLRNIQPCHSILQRIYQLPTGSELNHLKRVI